MRGRNPHDEHDLTVDLLEQLVSKDVVEPESIPIATVRDWFPTRERDLADRIVAGLTRDADCPLEFVTDDEGELWLTDAEETREFVADLRDEPPWFDY